MFFGGISQVSPWVLYPAPNPQERPPNPLGNAPQAGFPEFHSNGDNAFNIAVELPILGSVKIVIAVSLEFNVGVVSEECPKLHQDSYVLGAIPNAKIKVRSTGKMNEAREAASGVGMDIDVMDGDIVMTAAINRNVEAPQCPVVAEAVATHLNWKAIAGRFYVYSKVGNEKQIDYAVCFPETNPVVPHSFLQTKQRRNLDGARVEGRGTFVFLWDSETFFLCRGPRQGVERDWGHEARSG